MSIPTKDYLAELPVPSIRFPILPTRGGAAFQLTNASPISPYSARLGLLCRNPHEETPHHDEPRECHLQIGRELVL